MATTTPLPATPWLCSHATPAIDGADVGASIHDGDGNLVATVWPADQCIGHLIALAPELLADLSGLLHALMLHDPDYRNKHAPGTDRAAAEAAGLDAASNAVATLAYAAGCGLPVAMPGLDQLEEEL